MVQIQAKAKSSTCSSECHCLCHLHRIFKLIIIQGYSSWWLPICLSIGSPNCDAVYHWHTSPISRKYDIAELSTPTWCKKAEHSICMVPGNVISFNGAIALDDLVRDPLVQIPQDLGQWACDARRGRRDVQRNHVIWIGHRLLWWAAVLHRRRDRQRSRSSWRWWARVSNPPSQGLGSWEIGLSGWGNQRLGSGWHANCEGCYCLHRDF